MRRAAYFFMSLLVLLVGASAAQEASPKKLALVIGVSEYGKDAAARSAAGLIVPPDLPNAVRDAAIVADALESQGFLVTRLVNPDKRAMLTAVNALSSSMERAGPDAVGLLYFAGHGAQGRPALERDVDNYLIPVDADLVTEVDLDSEALSLSRISATLRPGSSGAVVLVLDACRNFALPAALRAGTVTRGLAEARAAPGTIIAYATSPGATALDSLPGAPNGPYANALAQEIRAAKGTRIEDIFIAVRNRVLADTGNVQVPWENGSLRQAVLLGVAPRSVAVQLQSEFRQLDGRAAASLGAYNCAAPLRTAPDRPSFIRSAADFQDGFSAALVRFSQGDYQAAADGFTELSVTRVATPPERRGAALLSVISLAGAGRTEEAARRLDHGLKDFPIAGGLALAQTRLAEGNFTESARLADQVIIALSRDAASARGRTISKTSPFPEREFAFASASAPVGHPFESVEAAAATALLVKATALDYQATTAADPTAAAKLQPSVQSALKSLLDATSALEPSKFAWLIARSNALAATAARGDWPRATEYSRRAVDIYAAHGFGGPLELELRSSLAQMVASGGAKAPVEELRRGWCAAINLTAVTPQQIAPLLDVLVPPNAAATGLDAKLADDIFRVATSASEGDTAELLAQAARKSDSPGVGSLQRSSIDATLKLQLARERLHARVTAAGWLNGARDIEDAQRDIEENIARLRENRVRVLTGQSSDPAGQKKVVTLNAMQAVLKPGEVYLRFVMTPRAGYAIAVTSGQARAYRIQDVRGLETRLQNIQNAVFVGLGGRPRRMLGVVDDATDAYKDLFGPAADLVDGANRLIIDATGATANIPFALLISRPMPAEELATLRQKVNASNGLDFTGVPWLGRDRSISMVAGVVSFLEQRADTAGSRAPYPVVAFAATPTGFEASREEMAPKIAGAIQAARKPLYDGAACKLELEQIYRYPGLAGADESAMRVARLLAGADPRNIRVVSGGAFTDANLLSFASVPNPGGSVGNLDQYRVLYFGSHGQQPEQNECLQEPLLVTTTPELAAAAAAVDAGQPVFAGDGILTASEILSLKLDADLVVLAASETVGLRRITQEDGGSLRVGEAARLTGLSGLSGGGVIGNFAASFFIAGARSVLATYWLVQNDATNRFMDTFFEATARGVPQAEAVRLAQLGLMDDPTYSNPVVWAPFVLIGDGSQALKIGRLP